MEHPILSILGFFCLLLGSHAAHNLQTYIVHLHHPDTLSSDSKLQHHLSVLRKSIHSQALESQTPPDDPSTRMLYSYHSAIDGFAATLTEPEAQALRRAPGVVSVRPDRRLDLHTTYSYKFMGLGLGRESAWAESRFGLGTIIGILDTGVWPESPSFDDNRMPPPPPRWRGACELGEDFGPALCNRKLIGARFYTKGHRASSSSPPPVTAEYISARDSHGHGTHTASTAAGAAVAGAGVLGNGEGVARGAAPGAHLAVYKVCWFSGCYSSDILAGMDDAIWDGVDVLSISLGGFPLPFYDDSIAIGGFRAVERGISVVCAAGNSGPAPGSVANEAPWINTVGAATMDRRFPALLRLGDGQILYGESMYPGNRFGRVGRRLRLVYGGGRDNGGELCFNGTLPRRRVNGKMVICDRGMNGRAAKGEAVREAGGAAMILANSEANQAENSVDVHVLPATQIGYEEALRLKTYVNSTRNPTARIIYGGTVIGRNGGPGVALFSSRGPSLNNPSILKPDVIAPGVNIVAAWPSNLGPSGLAEDTRRVGFTVLSGTSMSCPHVSGISALIRGAHPTWSPAAIRSAIMTTADVVGRSGRPIADGGKPAGVFAVGAGHVNPTRAVDPGLVYDVGPEDYVVHLCTLNYKREEIYTITRRNVSCQGLLAENRGFSLNYPSISVVLKGQRRVVKMVRRVTNVGRANSTYSVQVGAPEGVRVRVRPRRLRFERLYESKVYRVWFVSSKRVTRDLERNVTQRYAEGHLTWVHGRFKVRSPVSVTWTR